MPEEAPQEIADLVSRCTGDVEERPDAQECAEIIAPYVRTASLRTNASQPLTPGAAVAPRRTSSGGSGGEAGGTAPAAGSGNRTASGSNAGSAVEKQPSGDAVLTPGAL